MVPEPRVPPTYSILDTRTTKPDRINGFSTGHSPSRASPAVVGRLTVRKSPERLRARKCLNLLEDRQDRRRRQAVKVLIASRLRSQITQLS